MRVCKSLLIAVILSTAFPVLSQSIVKGPYLILTGKNTEMKVLWQNNISGTDQIKWGTDLSYSLGSATSHIYGKDFQHSYTITGLTPGTKYFYQVKVGSTYKTGSFLTAPSSGATSVKFLAYGDTRSNPDVHNNIAKLINSTYSSDPGYQTVLLSMGDLVSAGYIESRWTSEFFNYGFPDLTTMLANMPYESAAGNHEFFGSSTLFKKYFPYPYVSNYYFSFDYGPAHIIVLDQYSTSYAAGSPQYNWLVKDLAASTKPWKFIILHEPGWSAGGVHRNNVTVQTDIEPLCVKYKVPIVFAGHNHYYARAAVPAADGSKIQHITTGDAGAPLYTPHPSYPYVVICKSVPNFCKINIVNQYVLHFEAISGDGKVIDQFTIDRTPVKSK